MKILLLGKDGQVGWELQRSLALLGELHAPPRAVLDLADLDAVARHVRQLRPGLVVNAAAFTGVDQAESAPAPARRVNAEAVGVLAREARDCNAWLVHYSTDYVFDGAKDGPYAEDDPTAPLSVYGATKCEGEQLVRAAGGRHLILRTSWVFGARGGNFARTILKLAMEREQLTVVADQHGAPTSAELVADATALALHRILGGGAAGAALGGTYHLAAGGATSWFGYAQYLLEQAQAHGARLKCGPARVLPVASADYPRPAPRPCNSRLDTARFRAAFELRLPDWRDHVQRLVAQLSREGTP